MKLNVYGLLSCLLFLQFGCSQAEKKSDAKEIVSPKVTSKSVSATTAKPSAEIPIPWKLPPHPVMGAQFPPVELKIVSEKNRVEVISNCHVSVVKSFINDELRTKRIEAVDFKVKST